MKKIRLIFFAVFLCASLAYACWTVSTMYYTRFVERKASISLQKELLEFQPCTVPPWQNRVLFPVMVDFAVRANGALGFNQWYHLLRFLWIFFTLFTMFFFLMRVPRAGMKTAAVGTGMLAYMLIMTFFGYEAPSDVLDAFFFVALIWLAVRKRPVFFLLTALLASFNRESSAFSGMIWFALHGITERRTFDVRQGVFAVACSILAYALVEFLRFAFSGFHTLPEQWIVGYQLMSQLSVLCVSTGGHCEWGQQLIFTFIPVGLWLFLNRTRIVGPLSRLYVCGWIMAAITLISGDVELIRIFIPTCIVFIYVAVASEARIPLAAER